MFSHFKSAVLDYDDPYKRRVFIDNGGSVLLVAHLDTVQKPKIVEYKKDRIYARGLDDRLGAYIGYKLSTMLHCDLLLCDNEESGRSTAQYHDLNKRYNWICELDRAGDDVVTYDIDSRKFLDDLDDEWALGWGSFSDICSLDTDVCCFNLGIGYEKAHSKDSYAVLSVMNHQIKTFIKWYEEHKDTRYDFFGDAKTISGYGGYYNRSDSYDWLCEICGLDYGEDVFDKCICERCFRTMYQDAVGV